MAYLATVCRSIEAVCHRRSECQPARRACRIPPQDRSSGLQHLGPPSCVPTRAFSQRVRAPVEDHWLAALHPGSIGNGTRWNSLQGPVAICICSIRHISCSWFQFVALPLPSRQSTMSRGLGRIERAILALIEDNDAGKNGHAEEACGRRSLSTGKRVQAATYKGRTCCGARAIHSLAHKYPDPHCAEGRRGPARSGSSGSHENPQPAFDLAGAKFVLRVPEQPWGRTCVHADRVAGVKLDTASTSMSLNSDHKGRTRLSGVRCRQSAPCP